MATPPLQTQTPKGALGGAAERPAALDASAVQRLVDQASYFNLFSVPVSPHRGTAMHGRGSIVGVNVEEALHRFCVTTQPASATAPLRGSNLLGERLGSFRHRWLMIPDGFVASPGQAPPPTELTPSRPQRFVMLDSICTFGDGTDGFRGFGTGRTLPTERNGRRELLVTAVGTILDGFGRFKGHQGTYVYCGVLDPDKGFRGNLMLRVMDPQAILHAEEPLSMAERQSGLDAGITYIVFRGEAIPSDAVSPNIGPDGNPIGLIVQQGLKLHHLDSAVQGRLGVRASDRVGQTIGRITAYVTFNPASASGTPLEPVPFTAYDEFVFFDREGGAIGGFTADSSEGRVFNVTLAGQPAIRFGGVGGIREGRGAFTGIEGLMTDNSVVVFSPHVSASIYVLRINDPIGRFRSTLENV